MLRRRPVFARRGGAALLRPPLRALPFALVAIADHRVTSFLVRLNAIVNLMSAPHIAQGVNTALYRLLGLGVLQNNSAGRRTTG